MTKRYDEAIDVMPDPVDGSTPVGFWWRGRRYEIDRALDAWRDAGEWWNGDGHGRDREYLRVLARPAGALATGDLDADGFMAGVGAVYDLYLDRLRGSWHLARLWD